MRTLSFIKSAIDDSARGLEAIFEEDKTTDDLIEGLTRLAAGLNPVVRDVRKVINNQEE